MKIVGKTVEAFDGYVVYFTDGTAITADHDGELYAMDESRLRDFLDRNPFLQSFSKDSEA